MLRKSFPRIIVVTGTPGVGKTTISKILAKRLQAEYISLRELVLKYRLVLNYDRELLSWIIDEDRVRRILRKSILRKQSKKIVIDTHILSVIDSDLVDIVVVLRLHPKLLLKRLKERHYPLSKIKANIQCEVMGLCTAEAVSIFSEDKVVEINTSDREIEEALNEVVNALNNPEKYRPGKIDWSQVIFEDELVKYLT
ncbi:MAG: NMP kinase [Thermoprotei archaeon]|nr:MAG: NMP kinase [Thermoprotei archaeon]RLF00430.1 MAG: NMP kinase [Thermoprotei archaeon]